MTDVDFLRVAMREASLEQLQNALADNIRQGNVRKSLARIAIEEGRLDVLQYLHATTSVDRQSSHNKSSQKKKKKHRATFAELYRAAKFGRHDIVNYLVTSCGAPLNERTGEMLQTPLEYAVEAEDYTAASVLLKAGALISVPGETELKPLHQACRQRSVRLVELLLQYGPDLAEQDLFGHVPLDIAAQKSNVEIVEMLIQAGADVNRGGPDEGPTALHLACEFAPVPVVQCLLQHGAQGTRPDVLGALPIEYAIRHGRENVVKLLVEQCGMNQPLQYDQTLLHVAAMYKMVHIVQWLLEQPGVNPNASNLQGKTPLHSLYTSTEDPAGVFLEQNHNGTLQAYLETDQVNVNARDDRGRSPLHLAVRSYHNHGRRQPHYDVHALAERGADINAVDDDGFTPLHHVCTKETDKEDAEAALMGWLIDHGARIDAATTQDGFLPLHLAITHRGIASLRMLICKGASVATADNLGRTALHLACERGAQANVFTQFVTDCFTAEQAGDAINAVTNNGCTPLHYASYYNRGYYIACLLEHGAKLEARNNAGQTPLHMVGLKISKVRSGEEGRAISDDLRDTAVAEDAMEVENDYDSDEGLPYAVSDDNVYLGLLKQGADITARDNMGDLPFFLAAATEWLEATFEMLRLGAVQGLFEKNHR